MTAMPADPQTSPGVTDGLTGRRLGDFELLEEIGRGGMGVIFRARQVSLDRVVALKILSANIAATETARKRFQSEARATAKLSHPNIIPVYDQGHVGEIFYYAMQLVSGKNLHGIISELAEQAEVVYSRNSGGRRELSGPGSRAGGRSGSRGAPAGSSGSDDPALAETELLPRPEADGDAPGGDGADAAGGSWNGAGRRFDAALVPRYTEAYFDEIARHIRDVADALDYAHRNGIIHRDVKPHNLLVGEGNRFCVSDFGLARVKDQPGVTVTGEVVGSPLYMAPEQVCTVYGDVTSRTDVYSLGATLYEWLTLAPPYPGTTREQVIVSIREGEILAPRTLNSKVPVDLETICLKALERDPHRRYATAGAMRDDLIRFLGRDRVRARRPGTMRRIMRHVSRRRLAATMAVGAVLVAVLLTEVLHQQRTVSESTRTVVSKQEEVNAARQEVTKLQQENEQLAEAIISNRFKLGGEVAEMLTREFGGVNLVSGLLGGDRPSGAAYRPREESERLADLFVTALRRAELNRLQETDPAAIKDDPVQFAYVRGLLEPALPQATAFLDVCLSLAPEHYEARLLRAWLHSAPQRAAEMLEEADHLVRLDRLRSEGYALRAAALMFMGQWQSSQDSLRQALDGRSSDREMAVLEGHILAGLDEREGAIAALTRALIAQPDSLVALLKRAALAVKEGRFQAAAEDLSRVLAEEPGNAEARESRGECYEALGKYDDALADYLRAAEINGRAATYLKVARVAAIRDQQREGHEGAGEQTREARGPRDRYVMPTTAPGDGPGIEAWLDRLLGGGEAAGAQNRAGSRVPRFGLKWGHH